MATDFYLVLDKDLKRLGTRGGGNNFYWLIDPMEIQNVSPFEVWDDYANSYTIDEFNLMLNAADMVWSRNQYPYNSKKVEFPEGVLDEYWKHKYPEGKYREHYKQRVMRLME